MGVRFSLGKGFSAGRSGLRYNTRNFGFGRSGLRVNAGPMRVWVPGGGRSSGTRVTRSEISATRWMVQVAKDHRLTETQKNFIQQIDRILPLVEDGFMRQSDLNSVQWNLKEHSDQAGRPLPAEYSHYLPRSV